MNGHEIEVALRCERLCRDEFVGVFAADTIPQKEYPGAYIVNTDRSGEPGQHWVAFYCETPGILEAFDSFGKNPGDYITNSFSSIFEKNRFCGSVPN